MAIHSVAIMNGGVAKNVDPDQTAPTVEGIV